MYYNRTLFILLLILHFTLSANYLMHLYFLVHVERLALSDKIFITNLFLL
jgi:hypothetical protein